MIREISIDEKIMDREIRIAALVAENNLLKTLFEQLLKVELTPKREFC